MEDEPEVIRQRMEETRTALSEKLEALESKMTGAVSGTTDAVTETVETVKESVQESAQAVAGAVQDTVHAIKETFDLGLQFERHPFLMMGGAVLAGFVGGRLLSPSRGSGAELEDIRLRSSGEPMHGERPSTAAPSFTAASSAAPQQEEPSVLREALGSLRGVAVGALMGLLRDMAVQHLPANLKDTVTETVNNLTGQLGGRTMPAFDLDHFLSQWTGHNGAQGRDEAQHHGEQAAPEDLRTGQASTTTGPQRAGRY